MRQPTTLIVNILPPLPTTLHKVSQSGRLLNKRIKHFFGKGSENIFKSVSKQVFLIISVLKVV